MANVRELLQYSVLRYNIRNNSRYLAANRVLCKYRLSVNKAEYCLPPPKQSQGHISLVTETFHLRFSFPSLSKNIKCWFSLQPHAFRLVLNIIAKFLQSPSVICNRCWISYYVFDLPRNGITENGKWCIICSPSDDSRYCFTNICGDVGKWIFCTANILICLIVILFS